MHLCDATFSPTKEVDRVAVADAAVSLVGALWANGQVWGDEVMGWVGGEFRATFVVPTVHALDSTHHSDRVSRELEGIQRLCNAVAFRIHEADEPDDGPPDSGAGDELYMFTHMFDRTSPICIGRNGSPVPLYLLPLEPRTREDLLRWMRRYRRFDELWIDSDALETAAYEQLASPASKLSLEGRELARAVEVATGLPTYYYLMRYQGRRRGEEARPCPECKAHWRTGAGTGRFHGIADFNFRGDTGRLVTNLPDDPD